VKHIIKAMKSITQRCESFVSSMADPSLSGGSESLPVFAVADLSFFLLRDFGTCLMKRARTEHTAAGASLEITEVHPKHKRVLKTLGVAIDNFMKRTGFWDGSTNNGHGFPNKLATILLYSKVDDRFDMVTLESSRDGGPSKPNDGQGRNKRK
jgi:hypothetical protein